MSTMRISSKRNVLAFFTALVALFALVGCETLTTTEAPVTTVTTITTITTTVPVTTTTVTTVDPLDALDEIVLAGDTLVYSSVTGRFTTTTNVTLPAEALGLDITWSTSNAAVITAAGVVTRPAYGASDSTVILTATIGEESLDFIVTVLAITVKPAAVVLQEAQDALLLSGISSGVAANITLPLTAGSEGVVVSWESDTPASLSNTGVVVRQSDNVTVILTATLSFGGLEVTKEFEVVVLSFAPYTIVADLAAAIALGKNNYARVPDVTVVGLTTDGYMIYDGTTLLFVYTGGAPSAEVVVGEVFTITGLVDYYNGSMQFNGPKDANTPTVLIPSEAAADVLTPRVISGSISAYIATLPTAYTEASPLVYEYITITTKVRYQDTTNYGTFLVNTDHNNATNIDSSANSPFTTDALMIYYKSYMSAVQPFNGLSVTLNVFLYSLRTDRNIYTCIFTGTADDVQTTLDDAGIVGVAKTTLAALFATEYTVATNLTLPTTLLGTTIVWSSESDYVNELTGAISMPLTVGQVDASLTATITRGAATDTLTVNFKVGELPILSVAEVIAAANNQKIRVHGIVTASEYYRTFFIQDATGGIAIYTSNATMIAFLTANLGKEVEVFGSRAAYNGLRQIAPTAITLIGDGVMPTPVNVDAIPLTAADMMVYQGQIVTMNQMLVKTRVVDNYGNVTITFERANGGATIVMKWDSRKAVSVEAAALLAGIAVGEMYNITNVLAWNNNPYLYFTSSTLMTELVISDIVVTAENFNTNKAADYYGISVGFALSGTGLANVASVKVELFDGSNNLLVANTSKLASRFFTAGQFSSAFIVMPGTYSTSSTWNFGAWTPNGLVVPAKAVITVTDVNGFKFTAQNTSLQATEPVHPSWISLFAPADIVVTAENFNTNKAADYYGISVGFALSGAGLNSIAAVKVELFDGSNNLLVANTGKLASRFFAGGQFSSAFIVMAGTYSTSSTWNFGSWTPSGLVVPAKAVITVTDVNGFVFTAENTALQATEPVHPSWASLFPAYDIVVTAENFNTNLSAEYNGISVGFALSGVDVGNVASVKVELFDSLNNLLVANISKDPSKVNVVKSYSSAFIVVAGTYSTSSTWTFGEWTPDKLVIPAKAVITVTDNIGRTYTAENATLMATEPVHPSWESLFPAEIFASDLFISEYIEGSSNNKALEIFNGTGATVNLSIYSVALYSNGSATGLVYNLTGTLADGAVLVLCNSQANATILGLADVTFAYVAGQFGVNWNGDDAIALLKNGVVIDVFGVIGTDPGTFWAINASGDTLDNTVVRKSTVTGPVATWDITQWDVYAVDTTTYLNTHTMD